MDGSRSGALRYWGLSYIPEYEDMDDERYDTEFIKITQQTRKEDYFSFKNRMLLVNCMEKLCLHTGSVPLEPVRQILEIGIGRRDRFVNTSTFVLTQFKHRTVSYVGIDAKKREWLIPYLKDNHSYIINKISKDALELDWYIKRFDLLHIDGSHSVNGVLIDWGFTEFVKDTGIILLHDIKVHPGPKLLVDAIDRDIYTVHKMFLDDPKDFGMAVVYKKENDYGRIID